MNPYQPPTLPEPPAWHLQAACRGPAVPTLDWWYTERRGIPGRRETQLAKRVCSRCPVQDACLTGALDRDEPHGVWGGLTATERRALTRRPPTIRPECGTNSGVQMHYARTRREQLCDACRDYHNTRTREARQQ